MFFHYVELALRSLRQSRVLTALMVLSLALGIGASISMLTLLRLLAGDPLPQNSAHIFEAQLDPLPSEGYLPGQTKPGDDLTYVDAMNLLNAHRAGRQAAAAAFHARIAPQQTALAPFFGNGVMTTADFFPMFDVPFEYGGGWSTSEEHAGAQVAVIADYINDKLFDGANSVGKLIRIDDHDFRIVGVLKHWAPQPRFYAGEGYGVGDAVFLPLPSALDVGISTNYFSCYLQGDQRDLRTAPCTWLSLWVELAGDADATAYKTFLSHYAQQQVLLNRFYRTDVDVPNLMQLLRNDHVVPEDVRQLNRVAFGFLLICVVNTVGLLLAKCLRRAREIGVRRALGASRGTIFVQFMVEAVIIGLAGGVLGLAFAELGLWVIRHQPAEYAGLARLDVHMFALTFVFALAASLMAGVLPAWRACLVSPAAQVKAG